MNYHKDIFKVSRTWFDKLLKKKKCHYAKGLLLDIEKCSFNDPSAFWNYIRKLGPKKKSAIPWEVELDGWIVTDKSVVLNTWMEKFSSLYNPGESDFNDSFKRSKLSQNVNTQSLSDSAKTLNKLITFEEVRDAVACAKNNKAVGTISSQMNF